MWPRLDQVLSSASLVVSSNFFVTSFCLEKMPDFDFTWISIHVLHFVAQFRFLGAGGLGSSKSW